MRLSKCITSRNATRNSKGLRPLFYLFSPNSMQYQVRVHIWKIEADSPAEGKAKVCKILSSMPESFVTVVPFEDRRPLWKKLLWG